jgi:hypothetical protein
MSFGWWNLLDTHRKLLSVKNPTALQFLTQTGAPGTYYQTLFKGTSIFCLAHSSSEWHTNTIHVSIVSRLKNPSLTRSPPLHLHRLKWDLTSDINKGSFHLTSPGQSVMERAGVLNVLSTLCIGSGWAGGEPLGLHLLFQCNYS